MRHGLEHLLEAWQAMARLGWEVGAAIERLAFRRQEGRHRPATMAGHRLHRLHINRVEIRALFAIDLDIDEVFVHDRGRFRIFKAFMSQDMAPMTCRIAYTQVYWLVFIL